MANMRFSELTTASALAESDILAISKVNGESASGYMSFKATMTAIAIYMNKLAVYSSDLDTTDKHIIGAINELKRLISLIPQFNIVKVQVLPTEDISDTTIYLVPSSDPQTQNVYDEFIHIDNAWEQVGSTAIDLSDYYTKAQIDGFLATKANTADVTAGLALKENKSDMQNDVKEIIESCYEEKTVTGNPLTVKTVSGSNAKALKVTMNPIQDLHGYSNPWVGGAGKNKLPNTYSTTTYRGITYTVSSDGKVVATGEASGGNSILDLATNLILPSGTYKINGISGGETSTYRMRYRINSGSYNTIFSGESEFTVNGTDVLEVQIVFFSGYVCPTGGITFEPMIRLSSVADSTFAPYSNICPISGRTEASVVRTPIDIATLYNGMIQENGTYTSNNARITNANKTQSNVYFLKKGTHTLSFKKLNGNAVDLVECSVLTKNASFVTVNNFASSWHSLPFTFTTTEDAYLYFTARKDYNTNLDPSNYKALIDAETHTHQYGQTVYGGEDDFVNGGATSTYGIVDLGDFTWTYESNYHRFKATPPNDAKLAPSNTTPANILCDIYKTGVASSSQATDHSIALGYNTSTGLLVYDTDYTDAQTFTTAMVGHKLCYELATPATIQTSAENISLLKGNNVLSTNADNMELSYQELPDITSLAQYVQTLEARINALEEAE